MKKKVLFLYTELAGYFLAGLNALLEQGAEIHVVRWPVNKEAPFEFAENSSIRFYPREDYNDDSLTDLARKIDPDILVCSGWMDKGYLKTVKAFGKQIPCVLTLDNHWRGDAKQWAAALISPFYLKSKFTHAWVPGAPQVVFAKKMGFPEKRIMTGFYTADHALFSLYYEKNRAQKQAAFPHRFLYIGRYVDFKGIFDMWEAFLELHQQQPNNWELYCLGTGDAWDQRAKDERIRHFGFVQPHEMERFIAETGVFILPSHKEPWAVTVHEFAAAGFPLICSHKVGAVATFLEPEQNGYAFEAGNKKALLQQMQRMVEKTDEELNEMAKASVEISKRLTPEIWAQTLLSAQL